MEFDFEGWIRFFFFLLYVCGSLVIQVVVFVSLRWLLSGREHAAQNGGITFLKL